MDLTTFVPVLVAPSYVTGRSRITLLYNRTDCTALIMPEFGSRPDHTVLPVEF